MDDFAAGYVIVDGNRIISANLTPGSRPAPGKASKAVPVVDAREPYDARLFRETGDTWEVRDDQAIRRRGLVARHESIAVMRATALMIIDDVADFEINKNRTQGHGIAAIYDYKSREALDVLALLDSGQEVKPADFPVLSALVGLHGSTVQEVAAFIAGKVKSERERLALIDRERIAAKRAVAAAETMDVIAQIVAQHKAATEGIA